MELIYRLLDKYVAFIVSSTSNILLFVLLLPVYIVLYIVLLFLIVLTNYDIVGRKSATPTQYEFQLDSTIEKLLRKSKKVLYSVEYFTNRAKVLKQYMKFYIKDNKGCLICVNDYINYLCPQTKLYCGKKQKYETTLLVEDMDLYFINQTLNKKLKKDIKFEVTYA